MITLTDQERERFAAYLVQETQAANEMAQQVAKSKSEVARVVVKQFRAKIAGYMIVIDQLTGGERMEVRSG